MRDGVKCWESEDRCDDCPVDNPDNKCSEYKPVDKKKQKKADK